MLFRDMYFDAKAALGWSFAQTYKNPNGRFILWHLPSKVDFSTKLITGDYGVEEQKEFQR